MCGEPTKALAGEKLTHAFAEKTKFVHDITHHTMLHEQLLNVYRAFRRDAHPMAVMIGAYSREAAEVAEQNTRSAPRSDASDVSSTTRSSPA